MQRLRTIFMGSAPLSCPTLQALTRDPECEVIAVVTQPDRPKGRDLKLQPTPVKQMALENGLTVYQPEKVRRPEFIGRVTELGPDVIIVAAYGQILPKSLLDAPRFGCINLHTSLLPKYRGAAPIQWAILNDEPETGVTIMKMNEGLDTGPILSQERTPITIEDTAQSLHDRLATLGALLLQRTMHEYIAGKIHEVPQPEEGACYAPKITKQHGLISWDLPARTIWNRVRGLVPWPCAFTYVPSEPRPQLLKIWQADVVSGSGHPGEVLRAERTGIVVATGRDCLRISVLQREGGRKLNAQEFLAGHHFTSGTRLQAATPPLTA